GEVPGRGPEVPQPGRGRASPGPGVPERQDRRAGRQVHAGAGLRLLPQRDDGERHQRRHGADRPGGHPGRRASRGPGGHRRGAEGRHPGGHDYRRPAGDRRGHRPGGRAAADPGRCGADLHPAQRAVRRRGEEDHPPHPGHRPRPAHGQVPDGAPVPGAEPGGGHDRRRRQRLPGPEAGGRGLRHGQRHRGCQGG
ncbi:Sigma-70 family RNA polymerase sigma factor, partial [Dysosmobacter welbionis]